MPIFNNLALQQTPAGLAISHQLLMEQGPFLPVEVSMPVSLAQKLATEGKPVPPAISGAALIDTGASRSCISTDAVQQLGLRLISALTVSGVGGPTQQGIYAARLRFPTIHTDGIEFSSLLSANLGGHPRIQDMPLIVLVGRELLAQGVFIYNGPFGLFTLAI